MKELLTYVAQNLVEHPEQVSVNQVEGDGETVLELRVAPWSRAFVLYLKAKNVGAAVPSGPPETITVMRADEDIGPY